MNIEDFMQVFEPLPGQDRGLDEYQKNVITHDVGPLWVIAGPGSGKTLCIALRCLKLLVVDDVPPRSIIVTTFTEKAARNLQDRIGEFREHLVETDPSLQEIDCTRLRIGTLHSLCNDIMQEFRYRGYQNDRLLSSEMEQRLFLIEHSGLVSMQPTEDQMEVWRKLPYLVSGYDPVGGRFRSQDRQTPPNRWVRTSGAVTLFNRIVEEMVDVDQMRDEGGFWASCADAYDEYRNKLIDLYRCDFPHLQQRFLKFLSDPQAHLFLEGDGSDQYPGISHVLVDEYQDTNPIQEEIYLRLTAKTPHNLCVVGDDDQSLYRFRGGTVECMVGFPAACERVWGETLDIAPFPLPVNYRSHDDIVRFCDDYIQSFDFMSQPGVRAPGKVPLRAEAGITDGHPAVAQISRDTGRLLANDFAQMVEFLLTNEVIQCLGQCALLMPSTRASRDYAGPFMDALDGRDIPYYNPRSRLLLEEEEVQVALGSFLEIVDPDSQTQAEIHGQGIHTLADSWRDRYRSAASQYPDLAEYVRQGVAQIKMENPGANVRASMSEILYHILSYEPFSQGWLDDPQRSVRLGAITQVFEAFSNVPPASGGDRMLGDLYASSTLGGGINESWRKGFYYSLLGILASQGLNEPENPYETLPADRLPIMTVHQAKGLQFPFVFAYGLSPPPRHQEPKATTLLERDLRPFRRSIYPSDEGFSAQQITRQDSVRFYYVAYSRARYALILLSRRVDRTRFGIGFGGGGPAWLEPRVETL